MILSSGKALFQTFEVKYRKSLIQYDWFTSILQKNQFTST